MNITYEVQVKKRKYWYVKVVSVNNGQTLLTSETYFSKWNAKRAARKLVAALERGSEEHGAMGAKVTYKGDK